MKLFKLIFIVYIYTVSHAHSTVGRGNLVLGHSVPDFPPNSGGIEWWNSTPRFASTFTTIHLCPCATTSLNNIY